MNVATGVGSGSITNVGPALDCVALHLPRLRVVATITPSAELRVQIDAGGAKADATADVKRAVSEVLAKLVQSTAFQVSLAPQFPLGAGLGGSAAMFAAVAAAAASWRDLPDSAEQIVATCAGERALWGHPGTHLAAAAVCGHSILCGSHHPPQVRRLRVAPGLWAAAVVPKIDWSRSRWKSAIPRELAGMKAIEQTGRAAALVVALGEGDLDGIRLLCNDRILLPALAQSLPAWHPVERAAREAGALAVWITGRGPSVAMLAGKRSDVASAADAVVQTWRAHSIECDVLIGEIDGEET